MLALHRPVSFKHSGAALLPLAEHTRAQIVSQKLRRPTQRNLANSTRSDLRPIDIHLPGECTPHITQQDASDAVCLPHDLKQPTAPLQRRHLLQHILLAATASALSCVGEFAYEFAYACCRGKVLV